MRKETLKQKEERKKGLKKYSNKLEKKDYKDWEYIKTLINIVER